MPKYIILCHTCILKTSSSVCVCIKFLNLILKENQLISYCYLIILTMNYNNNRNGSGYTGSGYGGGRNQKRKPEGDFQRKYNL
jgi:hypothetical protein